jgi:hypothetical protein
MSLFWPKLDAVPHLFQQPWINLPIRTQIHFISCAEEPYLCRCLVVQSCCCLEGEDRAQHREERDATGQLTDSKSDQFFRYTIVRGVVTCRRRWWTRRSRRRTRKTKEVKMNHSMRSRSRWMPSRPDVSSSSINNVNRFQITSGSD